MKYSLEEKQKVLVETDFTLGTEFVYNETLYKKVGFEKATTSTVIGMHGSSCIWLAVNMETGVISPFFQSNLPLIRLVEQQLTALYQVL